MRRLTQDQKKTYYLKRLCGGLVASLAFFGTALAADPIFRVDLNKTQILRLPAPASSVIVGDTKIADVTVHSPTMVLVVGRGYGETNLVILDRSGQTLVDADIQVTSTPSTHGVRLFKATNRESYSCSPYCQPSPVLGDNPEFAGAFGVQGATPAPSTSVFDSVADAVSGVGGDPLAGATGPDGFN